MALLAEIPPIEKAHDFLGLTYRQIATAIGADESTLHRWRSGDNDPSPIFVRRLETLDELVRETKQTFRGRTAARAWLERPSPSLAERSPMELLLEGRIERVGGLLLELNLGVAT